MRIKEDCCSNLSAQNTVSLTRNDPRGGAVGVGKGKTHMLTASRLVANSGNFSSGKIENRIC